MKIARGQALIELALCAPLVALLGLGTVASVQVASARSGLQAATQAAAEAAARAPNAPAAIAAANDSFQGVIATYALESATVTLSIVGFDARGTVTASSSASIDVAWAAFLMFPGRVVLRSQVKLSLEPWRSHTA